MLQPGKSTTQISCLEAHNWLTAPATTFLIHSQVCATLPLAAPSWRLSMAGESMQAHCCRLGTPLKIPLAWGPLICLAESFSVLPCTLMFCLLSPYSSCYHFPGVRPGFLFEGSPCPFGPSPFSCTSIPPVTLLHVLGSAFGRIVSNTIQDLNAA